MSALPWSELLRAATHFGLTPPQFWALSVTEWRALVGDSPGLDGARLADLCATFPDHQEINYDPDE
jgi:hypothetical protein